MRTVRSSSWRAGKGTWSPMSDCRNSIPGKPWNGHAWEPLDPGSDRVNCILCDARGTVLADPEQALGPLYAED